MDAQKATSWTAFADFIEYCHLYLSQPIQLRKGQIFATQGPPINTANRFHPTYLRQWTEFPRLQQEVYSNVPSLFHTSQGYPPAPFTRRETLESLGSEFCRRVLVNERDVEIYGRMAIETKVQNVLRATVYLRFIKHIFKQCGVLFGNHPSTLSETLDAQAGTTRSKTGSCYVHQMAGTNYF